MSSFLVSHGSLRNLWLDPHSLKMAATEASDAEVQQMKTTHVNEKQIHRRRSQT